LISGYKKEFKYVYRFSENSANIDEEFEQICRMVYFRQNMLLVIEEIQTFTNTNVDGLPYALKDLLLKGRHKKIALGFTTQRPALLNKTIISQNDYVFCGNLQAKSDIDYIAFHTGINKDDIQNLNEREFILSSIYSKESKIIKNDDI
jgi:DNA helicase HerA-like ATPase